MRPMGQPDAIKRLPQRPFGAIQSMRGTGSIYHLCYVMNHTEILTESQVWSLAGPVILLSMNMQGFSARRAMHKIEK